MSRILVIEDSPSINLLIQRRMEMRGYVVTSFNNGADAIEHLRSSELPDVVLADVMMPGMDGLDATRRIKAEHPDLPVILVTAQQLTRKEIGEADDTVNKPIDFDALFATIERFAPACES